MAEPKTYPLRLPGTTKVIAPIILGFMTVAGSVIPVAAIREGKPEVLLFAVFWFGIMGFIWFRMLSLPQAIILRDDAVLDFRSVIGTKTIMISALRSFEPVPNQFGFFRVRHDGGSVIILLQFDGFHQLAAAIKRINPRVQMLGC